MRVIKRIKDNDQIIGYMIDIGNNDIKFFDKLSAFNLQSLITNAVLLKDCSDYKGKSGVIIETINQETQKSIEVYKSNSVVKINTGSYVGDYYGKQFINICRKLRRYATSGNISIDMSSHKSNGGNNTHLFRLIESCGVTVRELIVGYLSVIQPYSLQLFQGSKDINRVTNVWVNDVGYGIRLVIKVNDSNPNAPVVVSFHESNINKGKSCSKGGADFFDKPCAVLIDNFKLSQFGNYVVEYFVQRGFIRRKICSKAISLSNDIALVSYNDIVNDFNYVLSDIFSSLYTSYIETGGSVIRFGSNGFSCKNINFMSYGVEFTNNICYLIDLFSISREDKQRKLLIDLAINIVLTLDKNTANRLKIALHDRFSDSGNKLYLAVKEKL